MANRILHVLFVDDDEDIHEVVSELLGGDSVIVEHAYNGRDALSRMRSRRPDLLILDVHMPVMDGLELREHMLRDITLNTVPVVVFTGHPMTEFEYRVLLADHYLTKPADPEKLMEILTAVAKQSRDVDRKRDAAMLLRIEQMIIDLVKLREELLVRVSEEGVE